MANAFSNIAEQINYFGNIVLVQLRNQLALVNRVNRDYDPRAVSASGATITIPTIEMGGSAQTRAVEGGVTVNAGTSRLVTVTMQQLTYVWELDNLQQTFSNVNLMMEMATRGAIKMADGLDGMITGLWPLIPYTVGKTDGSAAFNTTDGINVLPAARKTLLNNQAPVDRLFSILGTTEAFNMQTLPIYQQAQQAGDTTQLRTGQMKPVVGIQPYESQSVPTNVGFTTASDWGTPTVNGTPAIGATSITIAGAGASKTLTKGSIITIAGGGTTPQGAAQPYSLTSDVVTSGGGAATITISPALKGAPSNGDAITPVAYTGTHSINLVADPSAYLLVIRPQADFVPGAGVLSMTFTDPVSGLTFRLHIEANVAGNPSAGQAYKQRMTLDLLAGVQLIRPELAVRLEGQA